jgi:hypothetical protein
VEKREEGVAASAEVRRSKRLCCVCFQSFALVVAAELESKELESKELESKELESKELESKERESKELKNKKLENKGGITWMTTRIPLNHGHVESGPEVVGRLGGTITTSATVVFFSR